MILKSGKYRLKNLVNLADDWSASISSNLLSDEDLTNLNTANLNGNREHIKKEMRRFVKNNRDLIEICSLRYNSIKECINDNFEYFYDGFIDTILSSIYIIKERGRVYRELYLEVDGDLKRAIEIILSKKKIGKSWTWDEENYFLEMEYDIERSDNNCFRLEAVPVNTVIYLDISIVKNMTVRPPQRELFMEGDVKLLNVCPSEDWDCLGGESNLNNGKGVIKSL